MKKIYESLLKIDKSVVLNWWNEVEFNAMQSILEFY